MSKQLKSELVAAADHIAGQERSIGDYDADQLAGLLYAAHSAMFVEVSKPTDAEIIRAATDLYVALWFFDGDNTRRALALESVRALFTPREDSEGGPHWEGCWGMASHGACARAEVERLREEAQNQHDQFLVVAQHEVQFNAELARLQDENAKLRLYNESIMMDEARTAVALECAESSLAALRKAAQEALNELGVPHSGYPANIANAVDILRNALTNVPAEREP